MFFFFIDPEKLPLAKLFSSADEMLKLRDEMPLSVFKTFLGVAMWGQEGKGDQPLPMSELAARIGLPHQTVSRHLRYLGDFERPGDPGLGLVEQVEYPLNRRMKTTRLTPKGRALAKRLSSVVRGELKDDNPAERSTMGE